MAVSICIQWILTRSPFRGLMSIKSMGAQWS
ncbi:hypothetical protein NK6_8975 [Bradyrhizobium diazoefficiens]|uniref:Uncharacterized protein n=1 Tax=Bradyrhizobium diazoefficiens TaxID=1355477 RepID=A0A0E4BX32_9BRAD|nr:hypothetical protein NK6_8975 [Bradyrhizobium diazoefficiens]